MEPHGFTTSKWFSKFGIRNSEFRIRNSEFRIRNLEFGIQNSESGIQNSEFGIQNSEFGIVNSNGNGFAGPRKIGLNVIHQGHKILNEHFHERDVTRTEICHATPRGHVP